MRKDGIERRDAILDAALACFVERGLLGTGIEVIRRRAGASPSSIYHYFEDSNAIVFELLVRTFERLFTHLIERVLVHRGARASVEALVRGHIDWVFANEGEGRFMYQAMALELTAVRGADLSERKIAMIAPLLAHIEPFVARGVLPAWSPVELDIVVLGPTHEACRRYLAGAAVSPEFMRTTLPRLAWKAVSRESRTVTTADGV